MPAAFRTATRFLLLMLLAAALAACGGGGGGEEPPPDPVGQVASSIVDSARTGTSYAISVYFPASYASGTRTYPVIYAVEGDAKFGYGPSFTETRFDAFRKVMQQRGTEAILVGIGGTERRNTDFLMPGARQYHAFIVEELIPRVEAQYRADPSRRALSGLSHGGYFVVAALFLEGTAGTVSFSHFLSSDLSTGANGEAGVYALEQQMFDARRPVPTTVFLAGGIPGQTNGAWARTVSELLQSRNHAGLAVEHMNFATSHVGTDVPAFEEALRRYFP